MYYKIVNRFDVECLEQSVKKGKVMEGVTSDSRGKVMEAIRHTISIFDEYYGEQRNPESDLGGFLVFLPTLQDADLLYDDILKHYNLNVEYAEVIDEIADSGNVKFVQQTFILSSDFGLVLIFPKR